MKMCEYAIRSEDSRTGWVCAAWVRGYCMYMKTLAEETDGKRGRILTAECWEAEKNEQARKTKDRVTV